MISEEQISVKLETLNNVMIQVDIKSEIEFNNYIENINHFTISIHNFILTYYIKVIHFPHNKKKYQRL